MVVASWNKGDVSSAFWYYEYLLFGLPVVTEIGGDTGGAVAAREERKHYANEAPC